LGHYSLIVHAPAAPKPIDPDLLMLAYRSGIFPMADSRDDPDIFWVEPQKRAIIPLDEFHCSRSLARTLRRGRFRVSCNEAFEHVIKACAGPRRGKDDGSNGESWISERIVRSYVLLHRLGHAHSIECWQEDRLVGAMAWLVARMRVGGYALLDCQFMTEHLQSLGAIEISQKRYLELLSVALAEVRNQVSTVASPSPLPSVSAAGAAGAVSALSAGSDWGALDRLLAESSLGSSSGASSPGKLILHSLTHTS